ncbi:MAG: hypothetical protein N4A45_06375 [Flavobacteriales bacterium]|nr:hypothetical protein [Flavobacteriales bacterium]
MKKNYLIILLFSWSLISCGDQFSYSQGEKMVTGTELRPKQSDGHTTVGNPNNYGYLTQYYPNPSIGELNIYTWNPEVSIEKVFILPGETTNMFESIEFENSRFSYLDTDIKEYSLISQEGEQGTDLKIDVHSLDEGFYKAVVYYNEGTREWFSFYKAYEQKTIEEWESELKGFFTP